MPKSNQLGRTFEYAIVEEIISNHPKSKLECTARLIKDQQRDQVSFLKLPKSVQLQHKKYASTVYEWLNDDFRISQQKISIDRMSDIDARRGDVTDIKIVINGSNINLSVKHNHFALKHQRPPTTAIRCGFASGSKEDVDFRDKLGVVTQNFITNSLKQYPTATLFNEIKSNSPTYIDKYLYLPICKLVSNFINENAPTIKATALFDFLVGNTEFYKVTAFQKQIVIEEYARLQKPVSVTAEVKGNSYVVLKFSNNWDISMRIHTASSRIGRSPSLKFDTQLIDSSLPKKVLGYNDTK